MIKNSTNKNFFVIPKEINSTHLFVYLNEILSKDTSSKNRILESDFTRNICMRRGT